MHDVILYAVSPGTSSEGAAALSAEQPAAADQTGDETSSETLRDELAKWRERVPKLAAALRQRTDEAQTLRAQLERLQQAATAEPPAGLQLAMVPQPAAAGIQARDNLIEELEAKLESLAERRQDAQGELHKRQLVIDELRGDATAWKEKWQAVTRSLDEQALALSGTDSRAAALEQENGALRHSVEELQARLDEQLTQLDEQLTQLDEQQTRVRETLAAAEAGQQALQQVSAERDAVSQRNEQLFETIERANRQVGSLTDTIVELRASLQRQRETAAERDQAARASARQVVELQARLQQAEAARQAAQQVVGDLVGDLQVAQAAALSGVSAAVEAEEFTAVLAGWQQAESALAAADAERAAAQEQVRALEERAAHLQAQLEERSALVVTLEQDQRQQVARLQPLQRQRDEFEEAVLRADRNGRETAEHVTQLVDKLERQQQLIVNLEQELAEAHERVQVLQPRSADDGQVPELRAQVRKLEGLIRERTEALNQLQWQREIAAAPTPSERSGMAVAAPVADGKLMVVLNQQLEAARAQNAQLLERVRGLEAARGGDDLTRIRGIGRTLAAQLNGLGISRYQQIAELDDARLADEQHRLHPHRGRIVRDRWIEQAVDLIGS